MEEKIYSEKTLSGIIELRSRLLYLKETATTEAQQEIWKKIGRGWTQTPNFQQAVDRIVIEKMKDYFKVFIFPRETEVTDFQLNVITGELEIVNPILAKQFLLFAGCR
jgi:hypothetical protein